MLTCDSRIDNHWRWILMVGVLAVSFALIAWLAIYLKRRHRRKMDEQRATVSGFPVMRERKPMRQSTATLEDMFGPHQLQHMTNGFQYTHEQNRALAAVGALGSAIRKKSRERKRDKSVKGNDRHAVTAAVKAANRDGSRDGASERSSSRWSKDRERERRSRLVRDKDIDGDVDAIEEG
jgi:hypothetical protein